MLGDRLEVPAKQKPVCDHVLPESRTSNSQGFVDLGMHKRLADTHVIYPADVHFGQILDASPPCVPLKHALVGRAVMGDQG